MHLLMMIILFGGVFYFVEINLKNNFINQIRNDALILASFSESNNKKSLLYQEKIIEDAVISGRLLSAQILNDKKQVARSWGTDISSAMLDEDFFFGEHNDSVFNIIINRYDSNGNFRGEILLGYDELPTLEQISLTYRYGVYLSLIYIIITFSLTMAMGKIITNPIKQLHNASYDISKGNYEKEIKVETKIRDIQKLATTLEHMRRELVEQNNAMKYQATHDNLTELPNRLHLNQHINQVISNKNKLQKTFALLMIDLDHFKEINDTQGHLAGDEVLKISAQRLQSCVRQTDVASRLGGDEFAVILINVNSEQALKTANKISKSLHEPFIINNKKFQIGASIGAALFPEQGKSFNEILRCADIAMYASKAKRQGEPFLYTKNIETLRSGIETK